MSTLGLDRLEPPRGTTYEVFNQSSPLAPDNALSRDAGMRDALRLSGGWPIEVNAFAAASGTAEAQADARLAHQHPPVLHNYDRSGRRVDQVEYHEAYHRGISRAIRHGTHSFAWENGGNGGAHATRAALAAIHYQTEPGSSCPVTMTFAAQPVLEACPWACTWVKLLTSRVYDPRDVPTEEKGGAIVGMSMTEVQGGSDVRANTTTAVPLTESREDGSGWSLRGAKWFTSAPASDAFLTLAQTGSGLSCFLVPRWLPGGDRNSGFRVNRLKDKLGDRSNASSEVEYDNAWGRLVGREGKGVATIMEMVVHTRLDCALGSASLARNAVRRAVHHCAGRAAFGTALSEAPLMQAVLGDLALETETNTLLSMRLAVWFDECGGRAGDGAESSAQHEPGSLQALRRLATAVAKYLICKRAPGVVVEALECFGGNGYDTRWDMERLYRQSPLNSIWEGSGNVQALDVLRTVSREPEALPALFRELQAVGEGGSAYSGRIRDTRALVSSLGSDPAGAQRHARSLAESLGTLLQAYALLRQASDSGSDSAYRLFHDTRLAPKRAALSPGFGPAQSFGTRVPNDHAALQDLIGRALLPGPAA